MLIVSVEKSHAFRSFSQVDISLFFTITKEIDTTS